jgi:hypothetical protein
MKLVTDVMDSRGSREPRLNPEFRSAKRSKRKSRRGRRARRK